VRAKRINEFFKFNLGPNPVHASDRTFAGSPLRGPARVCLL